MDRGGLVIKSIALNKELEAILAPYSNNTEFISHIRAPLAVEGRVLGTSSDNNQWPLLPLYVAQSINGEWTHALPFAAAMQFMLTAADIFDDLEDDDTILTGFTGLSKPVRMNIGSTLILLAYAAFARMNNLVSYQIFHSALETLTGYFIQSSSGQHEDLSGSLRSCFDETAYIAHIQKTSASQIQCACHIGAILSTNDPGVITSFADFGKYVGTALQLCNDIRDITTGKDICGKKVTLPVIFARNGSLRDQSNYIDCTYDAGTPVTDDPEPVKRVLFQSGGVHYTLLQAQKFIHLAIDQLESLPPSKVNISLLSPFLNMAGFNE
ncbi:Geranylgeranyl pyrophosphate synthase [Dehalogenimonas alkenigignens]|uniref:Geranylgeranyl pyrophosphate synthase n=1 Tax=Dehalogenimonas alkenigignens TaxID=1217799 RepID=A0A0W0GJ30_9CHLR|nr:polyprenyl synthetase family protein [Dehalogenimonas alkenigignens]KTB48556.1 Geranylgeranyl pyrophosphate synthase [Dehalogenimonas alkenigignens]